MRPIRSENSGEMQHNLEQKDNKGLELLVEFLFSLNQAFFLKNKLSFPDVFPHAITIYLLTV